MEEKLRFKVVLGLSIGSRAELAAALGMTTAWSLDAGYHLSVARRLQRLSPDF